MDSIGHLFGGGFCVIFRIGSKVASGMPKESLLSDFGAPFGRVWDEISEDLGCDLNIPSLGMPEIFLRCF